MKYRINYSVVIEADDQQEAISAFFNSPPHDGDLKCSCMSTCDSGWTWMYDESAKKMASVKLPPGITEVSRAT